MIPLQRFDDVSTFEREEYALAVYPTMYLGKVYLTACRVVLVDVVNILGDIQRYVLPGQRSSCKPHHLSSIHKISNQERAESCFREVLFYENLDEAGRALGVVFRTASAYSSGSSQEDSSGG